MNLSDIPPKKTLAIFFLANLLLLLSVKQFDTWLYHVFDAGEYLDMHMAIEGFSIIVSISIFLLGWNTFEKTKNMRLLFLSCSLLSVGLIDFMHLLSYQGMPTFITPNDLNKSAYFWVIAKFLMAASFVALGLIRPETRNRLLTKRNLFAAAIAIPLAAFIALIYYMPYLPPMFIQGKGLTPLKVALEYTIIGLFAISFAGNWKAYKEMEYQPTIYLLMGIIASIFAEVPFTLYASAYDTYNVIGHVFKAAAFVLIYKGAFQATVQQPYFELAESRAELATSEKELSRSTKAYDRIKEQEEFKKALTRVISHEIKSPLVPIVGYAEMLKSSKGLDKDQKKKIDAIYRNSLRAVELMKKMTILSKMEGGKFNFNPTKEDAKKTIEETSKSIRQYARARGIKMTAKIQKNMPKINMDIQYFNTILENLTSNAIKFTDKGGKIEIGAEYDKSKDTATFWVKDTGIGIKKEDMKKLFTPFYQKNRNSKEGTGLGLSICKMMTEASGGKIWAESEPGKGTKVTFTIPNATKKLKDS